MVKTLDFRIGVSEFELKSCYYVHFRSNTFGKDVNPLILTAREKVDMPLNNQTKPNQTYIDVYMHVYTNIRIYECIYMYIHTQTHMYIHVYMHIYMCSHIRV